MHGDICIFGASITYGAFDLEKGGWANRLRLYLDEHDYDGETYNLGVSGHTTEDLLNRFEDEVKARNTKKIIISIGANDSIHLVKEKRNYVLIENFEKNLELLINKAKKITAEVTFVGLIPVDDSKLDPIPWNKNRIFKNKTVKEYNNKMKEVCQKEDVEFIDIFDDFSIIENYEKLLVDGLHPNSEGHQIMFELINKQLNII